MSEKAPTVYQAIIIITIIINNNNTTIDTHLDGTQTYAAAVLRCL
jgi:hypothetical protein